jgi:hypothetical protein
MTPKHCGATFHILHVHPDIFDLPAFQATGSQAKVECLLTNPTLIYVLYERYRQTEQLLGAQRILSSQA